MHWMIDVSDIRRFCEKEMLRWTSHVLIRLLQRRINTDDVVNARLNGEIIEQYPTDYPYPSCLVLGMADAERPLHVGMRR